MLPVQIINNNYWVINMKRFNRVLLLLGALGFAVFLALWQVATWGNDITDQALIALAVFLVSPAARKPRAAFPTL